MVKRVPSVSIAVFGALVGIAIFWIVFMPWYPFPIAAYGSVRLALALVEAAVAIYLFTRWRSWPSLLLLVGSIPMVLVNIDFVGWLWRMDRIDRSPSLGDDSRLALLFPSDNEVSPVNAILHYLIYFSMVCLPIAFFWYFFRVIDRHLTKR